MTGTNDKLFELENALGYRFTSRDHLLEALHINRSCTNPETKVAVLLGITDL